MIDSDSKKWQELKREVAFQKYAQTVERRDYRQPNGRELDYYIRVEKPGACVLAFTTDNKIITVEQYRPGPDAVLRELPGGQVEAGKDSRDTAIRELLEETGYAGDVDEWIGSWLTDAYTQSNRTVVIIRNCKKIAEQNLEESEFAKVCLVEVTDFVAQVRSGRLTDTAGAMLALDHLALL